MLCCAVLCCAVPCRRFERIWRSLGTEPGLQAEYLATFKAATFKKVFKDAIATELLGSVFGALRSCTDALLVGKVLTGVAQISNLAFALTLLPADQAEALRGLFSLLASSDKHKISEAKLQELRRAYRVN